MAVKKVTLIIKRLGIVTIEESKHKPGKNPELHNKIDKILLKERRRNF